MVEVLGGVLEVWERCGVRCWGGVGKVWGDELGRYGGGVGRCGGRMRWHCATEKERSHRTLEKEMSEVLTGSLRHVVMPAFG